MKDILAVSFVGETRFLSLSGEEVEEIELSPLNSNLQTLFCGNIGKFVIQV